MKRLMIFCAALMSAAMLYGAIDFIKASNNGDMAKLYPKDLVKVKKANTTNWVSNILMQFAAIEQKVSLRVSEPSKETDVVHRAVAPRTISLDEFSRESLVDEVIQDSTVSLVTSTVLTAVPEVKSDSVIVGGK